VLEATVLLAGSSAGRCPVPVSPLAHADKTRLVATARNTFRLCKVYLPVSPLGRTW